MYRKNIIENSELQQIKFFQPHNSRYQFPINGTFLLHPQNSNSVLIYLTIPAIMTAKNFICGCNSTTVRHYNLKRGLNNQQP